MEPDHDTKRRQEDEPAREPDGDVRDGDVHPEPPPWMDEDPGEADVPARHPNEVPPW